MYLKVGKEFLWERIQSRAKEPLDANNARAITRGLLDQYFAGFETPGEDENPIVIDVEACGGEVCPKS